MDRIAVSSQVTPRGAAWGGASEGLRLPLFAPEVTARRSGSTAPHSSAIDAWRLPGSPSVARAISWSSAAVTSARSRSSRGMVALTFARAGRSPPIIRATMRRAVSPGMTGNASHPERASKSMAPNANTSVAGPTRRFPTSYCSGGA